MKKLFFLIIAALTIAGCSKEEINVPQTTPEPTKKEYTMSFGFYGEITDITESPLSRANSSDLYGIQVYSKPENEVEYKPYAYGVFDDKSQMTIKLLEGYKYKFSSTMVVDGKTKIHSKDGKYSYPFYINSNLSIDNYFTYSSNKEMTLSITRGGSGILINNQYTIPDRPNIDRYYGELADFTPSENGVISLNMKRVVFGVKVVAEGLKEGRILMALEGDMPAMFIEYPATESQNIYTFSNSYANSMAWTTDNYTETVSVTISWEKADGATVPLATQDVTFRRNKLTTINVKVKDSSVNNKVDITLDNSEMGQGDYINIDTL